jgi:hypothetical protein
VRLSRGFHLRDDARRSREKSPASVSTAASGARGNERRKSWSRRESRRLTMDFPRAPGAAPPQTRRPCRRQPQKSRTGQISSLRSTSNTEGRLRG